MKFIFSVLISVILLTGCASGAAPASYRQVSMEEAIQVMNDSTDYLILDVRTQEEYAAGHIPGAICIPNEAISDVPPQQLPDPKQLILVYCRSGNRSKQASQKLADLGYTNVLEFGGIRDWPGDVVTE